jgi:hypothetical protein
MQNRIRIKRIPALFRMPVLRRKTMKPFAIRRTALVFAACASVALMMLSPLATRADFIVNQSPIGLNNRVSQTFPDFPTFSTFTYDDFTTSQSYLVTLLRVYGFETGSAGANLAVTANIYSGSPGPGQVLVMTANGSEDGAGTLSINFGGQLLNPGHYWIDAFVNRSFGGGGQWFWDTTSNPVSGSAPIFWNPGGGFGDGTSPIPWSNVDGLNADQAFDLQGAAAAPAPAGLSLFALGIVGLSSYGRYRRKTRISVSV